MASLYILSQIPRGQPFFIICSFCIFSSCCIWLIALREWSGDFFSHLFRATLVQVIDRMLAIMTTPSYISENIGYTISDPKTQFRFPQDRLSISIKHPEITRLLSTRIVHYKTSLKSGFLSSLYPAYCAYFPSLLSWLVLAQYATLHRILRHIVSSSVAVKG